mgnify:CR=1 FL=1
MARLLLAPIAGASRHTASPAGRQRALRRRARGVARLTASRGLSILNGRRAPIPIEGDSPNAEARARVLRARPHPLAARRRLRHRGRGGPGVEQKVLALDEETGDVTRLLRFAAGVETKETITHDFWEEVWILSGELIDLGKARPSRPGCTRAARPAWSTGPTVCPEAASTLELRYGKTAAS